MSEFWLEIQRRDGTETREVTVHRQGIYGIVEGNCPGCTCHPFHIHCEPRERVDAETDRAGGRCMRCNDPVGWVYQRRGTIFGAEEDRAVIEFGRARVYGLEGPR